MAGFTFQRLNKEVEEVHIGEEPYIIENFFVGDSRGSFTKCYEEDVYGLHGVPFHVTETLLTISAKNVVRGIHFQLHQPQAKLVSVPYGTVWDVIVDLRPTSPTFKKWYSVELSGENHRAFYVPKGFGNGIISLYDGTMVLCQCDGKYDCESDTGIRFDDPDIGIKLPIDPDVAIYSKRDANLLSMTEYMQSPML